MPRLTGDFADRLHPQVVGYRHGVLVLCDDLRRLFGVARAEAPEAAVLYGGRILEALSRAAVSAPGLEADVNVYDNLVMLEQFGQLPHATRYWAHGLRLMANDARHVMRCLRPGDVDMTLVFLERWLDWFFCRFEFGPLLGSLWATAAGSPTAVDELVARLDAPLIDLSQLRGEADPARDVWRASPTLPAAVAELLLDRKENDAAGLLLARARELHPDDKRLLQLRGLWQSRTGDLAGAWKTLNESGLSRDQETMGITGGVAKRLWKRENKRSWLEESHRQ